MKLNIFKPTPDIKIKYYSSSKVFKPTRTTELLVKSIKESKKKIKKNKKILDLGCGSGVIGISVKKKIFKKSQVFLSDFSDNAVHLTKKNIIINKINCKVKKSNLMQAWEKENFDLIINDISGISSFFLKKNFWYNKFIPCDSGLDGTKLSLKFFKHLKKHKSLIIMPLISLSNLFKIKSYFLKNKIKFEILLREDWPLPSSLVTKYRKTLAKMKKNKIINYEEKFGMLIAYTEIILIKF